MNESKVNGSHGAKDKMPPGPHPPKNSMPNRMPPGRRPRGPRGPIMMGGEKPKNFRGSIKKLIGYVSPFKWHLLLVAFCSAATTVFTAVGPKILSLITNELSRGVMEMATGGSKGIDFEYIRA